MRGSRILITAAAAVTVVAANATGVAATSKAPRPRARPTPPIAITGAAVQGRIARVAVKIRGWRSGARFRIYVDGRYNNFSTSPTVGLALNLAGGKHALTADLVVGGRASRRSRPRTITVAQQRDPLLVAAGDIACDPADPQFNNGAGGPTACHERQTAQLVAGAHPAYVLTLGDEQYECGYLSAYQQSYDPTWGAFKSITRPIPGNHDYGADLTGVGGSSTPDCASQAAATGYFSYWGALANGPGGYYSYDVGGWHVIALNTDCGFIGGCGAGSPEELWLAADLAAHPTGCTLVYWHEPRWNAVGGGVSDASFDALWRDISAAHAELVLSGHEHVYARFTPLDASGAPSATGVRQIIVGTGGGSHLAVSSWAPTVQAHSNAQYGVLLLTLHQTSYEWQFEPEQGGLFTDYGTGTCH
jgi:hypothetical protein